ncbi:class I SAM-dependent methyltransferase [Helicobacter sp. 23-1045]
MKNDYFSARGVGCGDYNDAKLAHYFKEVIEGLPANARILDFGCGFGQILNAIKHNNFAWNSQNANGGGDLSKNYQLLGIDINENAIEACKNLGIDAIKVDDILKFSPKQKFDLIITTHCLEHLEKGQIIPILAHFREMLNENGSIFIAVPNAQSATGAYWAYEDFTHNTLFTAGSLIFVLKMAGFSKVDLIDKDALAGSKGIKRIVRKIFLRIYRSKIAFWNKITNSAFHAPSPQIFSYEIKAVAKK